MKTIIKRDGRAVPFDAQKIADAIRKAFTATGEIGLPMEDVRETSTGYAKAIEKQLDMSGRYIIGIEEVQDAVEKLLMNIHPETAKAYILYREERRIDRDSYSRLMKKLGDIAWSDAKDSDSKRENANIDGNTAMGTMLKFGSEGAKEFSMTNVLTREAAGAHEEGDIHIHDLDFLLLTLTCCQISLADLFSGGFSTGHGFIREPNDIQTYAALAAITIQANQNDMHGGQSIPCFDRDMAPGVKKTFAKLFKIRLAESYEDCCGIDDIGSEEIGAILRRLDEAPSLANSEGYDFAVAAELCKDFRDIYGGAVILLPEDALAFVKRSRARALKGTERATHQAMEAFVHNMNTMHSRAGAQIPFSSINYGTDTSPEGRMIIKSILKATMEGMGHGETAIFPIQIFRTKKGINLEEGDPNYDLFMMACECSAKRMFPNFSFQDAPFNLQFYDPNDPNTEIAYMGCRTRVIANVYDKGYEKTSGRGNLSFTSINLPRLAIEAMRKKTTNPLRYFLKSLDEQMELVARQLLERYQIQAQKKVYNFPFLMGQGIWHGSETLKPSDTIEEIIKHGTLSIGFIGLAETLVALTGEHHGQSKEAQALGLDIIGRMRSFCDRKSNETGMNFTLIATPAEGLSGRFVGIDKRKYGIIKGVADKDYYTNSFHVPVDYEISAFEKIQIEAPYHALTNAGHITYVELDGDPSKNLDAFVSIVKCMLESGIGYGAINHPIDRDPVCGYSGIIDNECPECGRYEDGGPGFERIRRITGYLVGGLERFNDAKRAEEANRVKHQ